MSKLKLVVEPGKHEILMMREFNAPRDLVFKALTDPALVPRWWGPRSVTTLVDKMDVRMGGLWRYLHRDAQGREDVFRGVYHEISAPERLVFTFEWEGMPGHIVLETVTLEESNGKTLLTDSSVFQSVADRDGMLQSGMEGGANESWERLEELLKTM
jgi:uncharacterized protein YndB with AHSA1/START domain